MEQNLGPQRKVFLVSNTQSFANNLEYFELQAIHDHKLKKKYLYNQEKDFFYEIKKIDNFGSYFQGNYLIEDGNIYLITPINPLFLILPFLLKARGPTTEEFKGKMLPLDHVLTNTDGLSLFENPGKNILLKSKSLRNKLPEICQTNEQDMGEGETIIFIRIDQEKFLKWIDEKFIKLFKSLEKNLKNIFDSSLKEITSKNITYAALEILYEYTPEFLFEQYSIKKHEISIKMLMDFKTHKRKFDEISELIKPDEDVKQVSNKKVKITTKTNEKLAAAAKNTISITNFFTKKSS